MTKGEPHTPLRPVSRTCANYGPGELVRGVLRSLEASCFTAGSPEPHPGPPALRLALLNPMSHQADLGGPSWDYKGAESEVKQLKEPRCVY